MTLYLVYEYTIHNTTFLTVITLPRITVLNFACSAIKKILKMTTSTQ